MPKLFLVGGAVRDLLDPRNVDKQIKDLDFSVEAESYGDMVRYLEKNLGVVIFLETPEYFTVRGLLPTNEAADFVLCRKDGQYKDGRHPEMVEVGTIFDDLARRDYTINAIAVEIDPTMLQVSHYSIGNDLNLRLGGKTLIDPYNGQQDLMDRVLKAVGNVYDRWEEDSLRFLRAIRFHITKDLNLSRQVWDAMYNWDRLPTLLKPLPAERIIGELERCFRHSTIKTLYCLESLPTSVLEIILDEKNIWLLPTKKKR